MSIGHKVRVALRQGIAMASSVTMPRDKSLKLERYLRGQEDARMLAQSDYAVVSYGKSGRTWLCVLLSRYFQLRYKLPADRLLQYDSLHVLDRAVPRVMFTHDNYLGDYTGTQDSKADYAGSRVVLLARHPADTAVSQFFQWKHRMRDRKKYINNYPDPKDDVPLIDFVLGESAGIPKIIRFMNLWAAEFDKLKAIRVVRYETLRRDTAKTLGNVLEFMNEMATDTELAQCVEFASVENMRKMEKDTFFKGVGDRMTPGDASNPDSYKVRRAKVGGYRDYFTEDEVARIDELVARTLSPAYGYSEAPPDPRVV
ncbi:sulfotransferase domain-containing protein [Aestuariivirga sp. YIM B02566]|uniref:Sulfotransferase domain-containing protein n=1 Tax=Taklimakanibacter albus TaxID=2800327 RepID=A0ACC5R338_9HYPH|nr:sulfotransferase domain-containing protein [Aestuariivirga sp. YIM B02566]MBK1867076.1 sulfotransferase domain-containing protein [Aestuariivirga sp. YIM B02566]